MRLAPSYQRRRAGVDFDSPGDTGTGFFPNSGQKGLHRPEPSGWLGHCWGSAASTELEGLDTIRAWAGLVKCVAGFLCLFCSAAVMLAMVIAG